MAYTRVNLTLTLTPKQAEDLNAYAAARLISRAGAIKAALRKVGAIDQEVKP